MVIDSGGNAYCKWTNRFDVHGKWSTTLSPFFFFFQASVFVRNRRHLLPTNRILFQPLRDIISINVTRIYSYQISLKKKRGRKIVKRSDVIRQFN